MIENKRLLFVATAVLFIVYTLGVIHVTLRIGFDVLHVEPQWVDVLLVMAFLLATAVPVYIALYFIIQERLVATIKTPATNPPPDYDEAWIRHFDTDEERRDFIRERRKQYLDREETDEPGKENRT